MAVPDLINPKSEDVSHVFSKTVEFRTLDSVVKPETLS